jgi:hypothetical protein
MHNVPLNKEVNLNKYFKNSKNDLFFKDYQNGKFYKIVQIDSFVDDGGNFKGYREYVEVDNRGNAISNVVLSDEFDGNTLYSLDTLFGGA